MLALYDHVQMLHEELGNCLSRTERKAIKAELKAALDELAKLERQCDDALFGGKPNAE